MAIFIPLVRPWQLALFVVSILLAIIPTVAIVLRVVARRISNRAMDSGDFCIIGACIFAVAFQIIDVLAALQCGLGYHTDEILELYGTGPIIRYGQYYVPLMLLWTLSLTLTKISLLLLYTKVFAVPLVMQGAKITGVCVILFGISSLLGTLLICQPISYNWEQTTPGGHCGDSFEMFSVFGVLNLLTDIAVLALPIPCLWKIKLAPYKKAALLATFGIGFLTCIVSVFRIYAMQRVDLTDMTYSAVLSLILSGVEPSFAVTLACVPLLRPLLGRSSYSKTGTAHRASRAIRTVLPTRQEVPRNIDPGLDSLDDEFSQYQLRPLGPDHTQCQRDQHANWNLAQR